MRVGEANEMLKFRTDRYIKICRFPPLYGDCLKNLLPFDLREVIHVK